MEEAIDAWLTARGIPSQLAPDSLVLVGLAGFLGGFLVLRQAHRDGAPLDRESRAVAITFVAGWLGAALFELLWILPTLLSAHSLSSTPEVDRNFYGGLLAGSVGAAAYLRWRGGSIRAYLDRSVLLWGAVVVCTRIGCFLEGCCFGRPTATVLGMRFPADSPVARTHADAGWIPDHAQSLPVHPSQLYEVALGVVATAIACVVLRRGRRDGTAFVTWIAIYAAGRIGLESLRASVNRSPIPWLTNAQLISVLVLLAVVLIWRRQFALCARVCRPR